MPKKLRYIIYSLNYSDDCGGCICLHKLCHELNMLGEEAYVFPAENVDNFITNKKYKTPIFKGDIEQDCVVVYPEIISGNPLKAKNVVRWLLNTPGKFTGVVNYGSFDEELFFYYAKNFAGEYKSFFNSVEKHESRKLFTLDIKWDVYKNKGIPLEKRRLKCHMFRKYENQPFVHDKDSICIDNLPHEKVAKIFNKSKIFISYDLYSFYSVYAALCGCISIVVPKKGLSREEWMKHEGRRYGIAYGFDDIEHALNTRDKLVEYLKKREKESIDSIKNFIDLTRKYFG